jgi:hypothetical protein
VAKPSFANLKQELDEACTFLRGFTLGHQGFSQQDGITGMQRVSDLCDRLSKLFASGPHAGNAATVVASGRTRIRAAQVRLDLLKRKRLV